MVDRLIVARSTRKGREKPRKIREKEGEAT
jgi:hypothetical protein